MIALSPVFGMVDWHPYLDDNGNAAVASEKYVAPFGQVISQNRTRHREALDEVQAVYSLG